jgi:hypothetical protein
MAHAKEDVTPWERRFLTRQLEVGNVRDTTKTMTRRGSLPVLSTR